MINVKLFYRSITHALRGILVVYRTEQSFRIQIFAAVLVLLLALWFDVRWFEWVIMLLLIGSVLSLELINSIFERLVDTFKPRVHPIVKDVKDIMAGAVLLASLFAVVVGFMIFWPYVILILSYG